MSLIVVEQAGILVMLPDGVRSILDASHCSRGEQHAPQCLAKLLTKPVGNRGNALLMLFFFEKMSSSDKTSTIAATAAIVYKLTVAFCFCRS